MQQFDQSVIDEKNYLDSKLFRLKEYIATTEFQRLDGAEKDRMSRQAGFMSAYSLVLRERIEAMMEGNTTIFSKDRPMS
jgi:hypothetical protein